jgi:hypothetical protein
MTANTPEQTSLDLLISLKSQYEYALTEANSKSGYLREQLSHVNALLLNQLLPTRSLKPLLPRVDSIAPTLAISAPIEPVEDQPVSTPSLTVTEPISVPNNVPVSKPRTQKRTASKSIPKAEKASTSKRNSLTPLLAYQGLKKLDAIAQVLEAARNQEITIDSVVQTLYGNLSAAEHKAERLRMKTALFQGVQKGMWKKATTPSCYFIGSLKGQSRPTAKGAKAAKASKAIATPVVTEPVQLKPSKPSKPKQAKAAQVSKAKLATTAPGSKRKSLPFLTAYAGMKKLDAIEIVLKKNPGEVLHHDTIIKVLYGDLSLEDLKDERVRIKTALLKGVKDGRWAKSSTPSSYFLKSETAASKSKAATSIKTMKPRSSAKARPSKK